MPLLLHGPAVPSPAGPPPVERAAAESGLSTDDLRVQLMQAVLVDALNAQLVEKRVELLERLVTTEKETRLAERDDQIAALRRRVRALADVD